MSKILLKSADYIGEKIAGTGLRYLEFAKQLSKEHEVVFAVPNKTNLKLDNVKIVTYHYNDWLLFNFARNADVVIAQNFSFGMLKLLKLLNKPIVIDLICPIPIENLEQHKNKNKFFRYLKYIGDVNFTDRHLRIGSFFICGNEEQRNFWLGMLCKAGKLNAANYDADPSLRKLIDIVPFGISNNPPQKTKKVLKGVFKSIKENDKVILWNGGIWDWLDPLTPVKAMAEITKQRDDIKLVFMGTIRPDAGGKKTAMCEKTIALAKELGILEKNVFFYENWVDYNERQNLLLESDIGLVTHIDSMETQLSFRTRVLDCIWTNLPILITSGGSISNLVENKKLGLAVPEKNVQKTIEAILKLVDDKTFYETCKNNLIEIAPQFYWQKVIKPLNNFCLNLKRTTNK